MTALENSSSVLAARPPSFGRWYVLLLLTALNVMLIWDKIILTSLFEPIRHEFHLADSELGFIGGSVYAVFMGIAGLPLGYLGDRMRRRDLAAGCLLLWSAATAACGLSQNVVQLGLSRLFVGVGEAGGGPASISMLADLFERKRRATAMAVFNLGASIAGLINLTVAAAIAHDYGWRAALLVASVPGILLAMMLRFTVREPPRGYSDAVPPPVVKPSLGQTLAFLKQQRSLIWVLAGSTFSYITLAGMSSWTFSYVVRVQKLQLKDIGLELGLGFAIGGLISNAISGLLVDRLAMRDERWRAWFIAAITGLSITIGVASVLVSTWQSFLVLTATYAALAICWFGPASALIQSLSAINMRSTIAGLFFLLSNMVGYGVGPFITGALSDMFAPEFGNESLRYAMMCTAFINLISTFCFLMAGRSVRNDLKSVHAIDLNQTRAQLAST